MKICIDVDNTLFPFGKILHSLLNFEGYKVPEPEKWDKWDFYKDYGISKKVFYELCNEIHKNQEIFTPFEDAKCLLDYLYKNNYKIIIASHRNIRFGSALINWLDKYNLKYDDIHLSYDKTTLWASGEVDLVIDDNPEVIKDALKGGIQCTGIRYAWNKEYWSILKNNLTEIKEELCQPSVLMKN